MKLKNQFLRLFAVLAMGMATTAWGDVTVDPTVVEDNGSYYVNLPVPLATQAEGKVIAAWNIPGNVKTFHVYDNGGPNGAFSSTACGSGCSTELLLTAPAGSILRVKGSLTSGDGDKAIVDVINGTSASDAKSILYIQQNGSITSWKTSSERNLLVVFRTSSNTHSADNGAGLDLTFEVLPGTLTIDPSENGSYNVSSAAGQFDLQIPAGSVNNTTTLTAPAGYVLYVEGGIAVPNGGTVTAYDGANTSASQISATTGAANTEGALSSSNNVTIQVATTGSGFAEAQTVTVHVLKKTTSTTAIDIYTQDDNSYAVAKITDGEYQGAGAVSIPSAINVDAIVYDRVFTANKAGTIVLPFSLPSSATTNAKFYYLKNVLQVEGYCKWKATFRNINLNNVTLPADNTPYAVIVPEAELKFNLNGGQATFQTKTIADQVETDGHENWIFKGIYQYKLWGANDPEVGLAYALAAADDPDGAYKAGQYVKVGNGAYAVPMRAYVRKVSPSVELEPLGRPLAKGEVSSIENLPEVIDAEFVDENEKTTAIGRLNTVTGAIKIDRWFDLKGRSTNHKPTTKGAFFNKKGIAK